MKKRIAIKLTSLLVFGRRTSTAFVFLALVLSRPLQLLAEDISICGVRFPVEATKRMNDGSIKVDINGYAKLVSPSQLNDYIVNETFKSKEQKKALLPDQLLDLIFCALDQGEKKWVELAITALIESSHTTPDHIASLILRLSEDPELIKTSLLGADEGEAKAAILAPLLLQIGANEPQWIRTYGARWAFKSGAQLRSILVENFISTLSAADYEKKTAVPLAVLEALYGSDDATVSKVRSVLSKVNSIQSALRGENLSSVLTLLSSDDSDAEVSSMLGPVVLETIHREAKNLLDSGRTSDALLVLSRLKLEKRTPTTHELVREALRKLSASDFSAIDHAGISDMLLFLCDKDEEIRLLWIDKLIAGVNFFISRGEQGNASRLVERLSVVPKIESSVIDPLRFRIGRAHYASGDESNGQAIILSMTRAPSFAEKLSLYAARLSRAGVLILVLVLIAAVAIGLSPGKISAFFARVKGWFVTEHVVDNHEDEEEDSPPELPRFVSHIAMSKYDPRLEEYSALLELFGLKLGATEKQIKAAYRSKMKEVHPDLKLDRSQETDAEFIVFRGKYERLLELHRSRLTRAGQEEEA